MSIDPRAPVIVAVAQQTWRQPDAARTPLDALYAVASQALQSSRCSKLAQAIDAVATVRFIADTNPDLVPLMPRNPGKSLAQRLGINDPACFQTDVGGNTPQFLVNHFAHQLADGNCTAVLISGAELLNTFLDALRNGHDISAWAGEKTTPPIMIGEEKDGLNDIEKAHGLFEPVNTYPLFESALRHHLGGDPADQDAITAELCSRMSAVAATNPHAWRQERQDAISIGTVTDKNRYIGFPYTRDMNAQLSVDMAAAVIMTTAGKAAELGIEPQQMIYLRAGVDLNDIWHPSERNTLYEAPAIGLAARAALQHAKLDIDDMDAFDIYSCFPSAVRIACNEIGISPLDARGITVTGGLPFFGGPGNNYSLHAVAEMVETLRRKGKAHGLVTANGLYLTKHSLGLYSTEPGEGAWSAVDSPPLQQQIDAGPRRSLAGEPAGTAIIESLTVAFDRKGPSKGILTALNSDGERIVANAITGLERMVEQDLVGSEGNIRQEDGRNIFEL